jgi:hypothetical protein
MYLPVPRKRAKPPKRPHRVLPRLADIGVQGRLDAARARRLGVAITGRFCQSSRRPVWSAEMGLR